MLASPKFNKYSIVNFDKLGQKFYYIAQKKLYIAHNSAKITNIVIFQKNHYTLFKVVSVNINFGGGT
jgi:hypothetical protein